MKDKTNMSVWVMGIKAPGYYVAKNTWDQEYVQHLKSLGYRVWASRNSPEIDSEAEEA